jgi:hypothetical protein
MPHTTTHAQATSPLKPGSQPLPAQAAANSQDQADIAVDGDQGPAKLSDVIAALHAHESLDAEQLRRAQQAALQARQQFD